jgi:inositol-phosphate phosphatase/L-galactose 1-phosphate phosphatase
MIASALASREKTIHSKSNAVDVVTETDRACEAHILSQLTTLYPSHRFVAEEQTAAAGGGSDGVYDISDAPTWFVDPIDGTTNFVHGFPLTCVIIGLSVAREMRVAVVHVPLLRETYTAIRGRGAFLNGERIHVSDCASLRGALTLTEFGYDRTPEGADEMLGRIRRLLVAGVQGLRSLGSCAINMCAVASGRADVYYEGKDFKQGPKPWDVAGPSLIVLEAGGVVADWRGLSPFDMACGRILAANSQALARELVTTMSE